MHAPQGIASNISLREGKRNENSYVWQEASFETLAACPSGCGGTVSYSFDECQLILATSIRKSADHFALC
jgi:hypothetical protein